MKTTTSKVIEIIVSPNGRTSVETKGFTGPACRQASKFLEEAIGKRLGERLTGEYHQTGAVGLTNQQHA